MSVLKLVSAADANYFLALLNLIGSLKKENNFSLCVYDLGLTRFQKKVLLSIPEVRSIKILPGEAVANPYVSKCLIWYEMHKDGGVQFFLDAGLMVCRNLQPLAESIKDKPLLTLPSSFTNEYCTPSDFYEKYNLGDEFIDKQELGSGFICFNFDHPLTDGIVTFARKMALDGDVEGWSAAEQHRNHGISSSDKVRDCYLFRHDETALNVSAYQFDRDIVPLSPMHLYNHCYKYEYIDQIIYTFRRRNRAPALKFVFSSVTYANRWLFASVVLRNVFAYVGLTLVRNKSYIKAAPVYKHLMSLADSKNCGRLLVIKNSDRKYSFSHDKTIFKVDEIRDSRWLRFDTFNYVLCPSEAVHAPIVDRLFVERIGIAADDVVVLDVMKLSVSAISLLIEHGVPFFIRFRVLAADDSYDIGCSIVDALKGSYKVYNVGMKDVFDLYDYGELFHLHPREANYQPMFHDREVVELLCVPKANNLAERGKC